MAAIEHVKQVAVGPVGGRVSPAGRKQVLDRASGVEGGALENGGQESAPPVARPGLRHAARVGNGDERRQIFGFAPQGIRYPSAGAGITFDGKAGAHVILARTVGVGLRGHRMDEAHVIGQFGQVRQQFGDVFARLDRAV